MLLSTIFAGLFYLATAILVVGLAMRIRLYARTPALLNVPTTPAPITRPGVVLRMTREVTLFESLFKSNKWTWLFGWVFHFAMLLVILRHLRYFTQPVWFWVNWIQPFGMYAGFAMLAGLLALWGRRFLVERVRYISAPSDHLMLLLLIGIAGSGLMMKYVAHTDIVSLKQFALGLIYVDWQPLPADPVLLVHLSLVLILMFIFPFSKLLHAPGLFFSPARNQVDNTREKRYLAKGARAAAAYQQEKKGK